MFSNFFFEIRNKKKWKIRKQNSWHAKNRRNSFLESLLFCVSTFHHIHITDTHIQLVPLIWWNKQWSKFNFKIIFSFLYNFKLLLFSIIYLRNIQKIFVDIQGKMILIRVCHRIRRLLSASSQITKTRIRKKTKKKKTKIPKWRNFKYFSFSCYIQTGRHFCVSDCVAWPPKKKDVVVPAGANLGAKLTNKFVAPTAENVKVKTLFACDDVA